MEAIVLSGGFGLRLKSVVQDVPKPMAPVRGKPFLEYVLRHCIKNGVSRIVLCVGHKHETIQSHFGDTFMATPLVYSVEESLLGTGGAVVKALPLLQGTTAFVVNGDSFFDVDLFALHEFHRSRSADFSLALKKLHAFDRYGLVRRDGDRIVAFEEKKFVMDGEINGGVYVLEKGLLGRFGFPEKFSLEKDFLEKNTARAWIYGMECSGFFIDIGVPADYARAQKELPDA